jgi:hypothetical protein
MFTAVQICQYLVGSNKCIWPAGNEVCKFTFNSLQIEATLTFLISLELSLSGDSNDSKYDIFWHSLSCSCIY